MELLEDHAQEATTHSELGISEERNGAASAQPPLIPHSRPFLGDDLEAVARDITASGYIAAGRHVERFEREMTVMHAGAGAVATSSGTAALHLALLAMQIGARDEVILPGYVCTAVLNAVRYVDATPVLADVDPDSGNICPEDARRRLTRRTRAIIVPHMLGNPADLPALSALGVPLIEDCAQALGADRSGTAVGSAGLVSIFSFYATKVITTGEGGMAVSKDALLVERMRDLRDYDEKEDYKPRYNYHMSDLAAGIGCRQLQRLPGFIRRRRLLAALYSSALAGAGFDIPKDQSGSIHYRYVVRAECPDTSAAQLKRLGVQAKRPVYAPLHRYLGGYLPRTDRLFGSALSLPLYPALRDEEAHRVVEAVRGVCRSAEAGPRIYAVVASPPVPLKSIPSWQRT